MAGNTEPEYRYEVVESSAQADSWVSRGSYACKADALYIAWRYKRDYDANKGPGHFAFDFSVRAILRKGK